MERRTALKIVAAAAVIPATSFQLSTVDSSETLRPPLGDSWDELADSMSQWECGAIRDSMKQDLACDWEFYVRSGQLTRMPGCYGHTGYVEHDVPQRNTPLWWNVIGFNKTTALFWIVYPDPEAGDFLGDALEHFRATGVEVLGFGRTGCNRVAACFVKGSKESIREAADNLEYQPRLHLPNLETEAEWSKVATEFATDSRNTMAEGLPDTWNTFREQTVWCWNKDVSLVCITAEDKLADVRLDVALEEMLRYAGIERLGKGTSPDGHVGWMFVAASLKATKAAMGADWIIDGPTMPWDEDDYEWPDEDDEYGDA